MNKSKSKSKKGNKVKSAGRKRVKLDALFFDKLRAKCIASDDETLIRLFNIAKNHDRRAEYRFIRSYSAERGINMADGGLDALERMRNAA